MSPNIAGPKPLQRPRIPVIIPWTAPYKYHYSEPLKGIVSVMSRNSPCTDGYDRFTTVPLRALSDEVWIRYPYLRLWKTDNFQLIVVSPQR